MNRRKHWTRDTQAVAESAPAISQDHTRVAVRETTSIAVEARASGPTGERLLVRYIRAGWSLNGRYWPADILKTQGVAVAVPGTQLYIDHATEDEDYARPAGSMMKLAAMQDGPAWWDEAEQAITANVRVFRPWREMLLDSAEAAGLSVRGWVTSRHGEVGGRAGEIVESIEAWQSVDFVTIPAAGGKIISVLESATPTQIAEARNAGAWFESFVHSDFTQRADDMYRAGYLTRDERIILSSAIGSALASFIGVIEADAPQLFTRDPYRYPEDVAPATAEESAAQEGNAMGAPTNTPAAAAPADTGSAPTAEAIGANARAQVAEAENARLAGAVAQTTEAQRVAAEAIARANAAEARSRLLENNEAARVEIGRQMAERSTGMPGNLATLIAPRVESALYGRVPTVAEGDRMGHADAEGLTAAVTAAIEAEATYAARVAEAYGAGEVTGLGGTTPDGGLSSADFEAQAKTLFEGYGMSPAAAALAAKGA